MSLTKRELEKQFDYDRYYDIDADPRSADEREEAELEAGDEEALRAYYAECDRLSEERKIAAAALKAEKLAIQRRLDEINAEIAAARAYDEAERDIARLRPGITVAARRWAVLDRLAMAEMLERIGLQRFIAGLDLFNIAI